MCDALACGRRFRTFNVIDDFNRQSVHIAVDTSINAARLVRVFAQLKRDQITRRTHGCNTQCIAIPTSPEFDV